MTFYVQTYVFWTNDITYFVQTGISSLSSPSTIPSSGSIHCMFFCAGPTALLVIKKQRKKWRTLIQIQAALRLIRSDAQSITASGFTNHRAPKEVRCGVSKGPERMARHHERRPAAWARQQDELRAYRPARRRFSMPPAPPCRQPVVPRRRPCVDGPQPPRPRPHAAPAQLGAHPATDPSDRTSQVT